tara:strand:+ start:154 stop:483 length:330 start_codon:yes stop_codon:yes gene_type:complete
MGSFDPFGKKKAKREAKNNQRILNHLADFRLTTSKTFDDMFQFRLRQREQFLLGKKEKAIQEAKETNPNSQISTSMSDYLKMDTAPPQQDVEQINTSPNSGLGGYIRSS